VFFGSTPYRRRLLAGLEKALINLQAGGCRIVYVDGSFVTDKERMVGLPPNDYDACWSMAGVEPTLLEPVFFDFSNSRAEQKRKFWWRVLSGGSARRRQREDFLGFFPNGPRERGLEGDYRNRPGDALMIKNQRQYRICKTHIEKFTRALHEVRKSPRTGLHPLLLKAEREAMKSQLKDLSAQAREFERLQSGGRRVLQLESFDELPGALIRARIARGMTQKQLAEKLGLKEQQIQRYEASGYATASFDRLRAVVSALSLRIKESVFLDGARDKLAA
jgi:hypothetical protein